MTKNKIPEILLVGLPNSGKSTLINAITKSKTSIIGSKPNTTRDKVTKTLKYENNRIINISDLPGFLENPEKSNINYQKNINKFMSDADKIFFVIDIKTNDLKKINIEGNIAITAGASAPDHLVFNIIKELKPIEIVEFNHKDESEYFPLPKELRNNVKLISSFLEIFNLSEITPEKKNGISNDRNWSATEALSSL